MLTAKTDIALRRSYRRDIENGSRELIQPAGEYGFNRNTNETL